MTSTEPKWCESWTSHDDTGEGERTYYHECSQPEGHEGRHTCFGHNDNWGQWETCNESWHNYHRPARQREASQEA